MAQPEGLSRAGESAATPPTPGRIRALGARPDQTGTSIISAAMRRGSGGRESLAGCNSAGRHGAETGDPGRGRRRSLGPVDEVAGELVGTFLGVGV